MKILIVAGEQSGEIYGARLIREIKKLDESARFAGIGGDLMKAEGMELYNHVSEMASIGVVNMLEKLSFFLGVLRDIRQKVQDKLFDAVILIDYPDFNLRVARAASEAGTPAFYYVCPQFWAWRRYRVNAVRKWIDTMLVALPFEEDYYRGQNVNAKFVGHPMLDEINIPRDREAIKKKLMPKDGNRLVGILPGSRKGEIKHNLGLLIETADRIRERRPDTVFVLSVAPDIPMEMINMQVGSRNYIKAVKGNSRDLMAASDLLITKSGTSTLEAAIVGVPMLIVYRFTFLSYLTAWLLTDGKYAGLPNIIADKEVAPEFMQYDFIPQRVADTAIELLEDKTRLENIKRELAGVRAKLGEKGAASRAAAIILKRLTELQKG